MKKINYFAMLLLLLTNEAHGEGLVAHVVSASAGIDLLTSKVAMIVGEVNKNTELTFQAQVIDTMPTEGTRLIIINSDGGYEEAGVAIIDMIEMEKSMGTRVVCFVQKMAMSMAFNILTHCDVRIAAEKAEFMFHSLAYQSLTSAGTTRLTPAVLRKTADVLEKGDKPFAIANTKALGINAKDYAMYSAKDHIWRVPALLKLKYIDGVGTLTQ